MTTQRHFEATWDPILRTTTALSTALLVGAAVMTWWLPPLARGTPPLVVRAIGPVLLIVLAGTWALAPSAFSVVGGTLHIHRRGAAPLGIPLSAVIEVAALLASQSGFADNAPKTRDRR